MRAAELPSTIEYGLAHSCIMHFRAAEHRVFNPHASNVAGATVPATGHGISFHLVPNRLDAWLQLDEHTGVLQGTPPSAMPITRVDVIVESSAAVLVCHAAVLVVPQTPQEPVPVDVRWVDEHDKEARRCRLQSAIAQVGAELGVELSDDDTAIGEHCHKAFAATHACGVFPFAKRMPRHRLSLGWRALHARFGGNYLAMAEMLSELLSAHRDVGACQVVQTDFGSPVFLLLNLSDDARRECEAAAAKRLHDAESKLNDELADLRDGAQCTLPSPMWLRRSRTAHSYVLEALSSVMLGAVRR